MGRWRRWHHDTQTTRAQLHWRIGATDLRGGLLQVHWRIGAAQPGTGHRRDKEASSGKGAAAVQTLQDRSERRAKLPGIDEALGVRARPWTATCEPTETRSQTDMEDGTIRRIRARSRRCEIPDWQEHKKGHRQTAKRAWGDVGIPCPKPRSTLLGSAASA